MPTHEPLNFTFMQNKDNFFVEEQFNKQFSNSGNFLILQIKKINTSTWELLEQISRILCIEETKIGYAGLKDKNATSIQYISIPQIFQKNIKQIESKNIKILNTFYHHSKIKIGDLSSNRFKIKLTNVLSDSLPRIYQNLSHIQKHGLPNYFGYQRFGKSQNFEESKKIAYGDKYIKDKKLRYFLSNAYQSYLFNAWLSERVQRSKEKNLKKLQNLKGDIISSSSSQITGLLAGRNVKRAVLEAYKIESLYDDPYLHMKGSRRDAWIEVKNLQNKYNNNTQELYLEFVLPKSSYATVLIESLGNKMLSYQ